MRLKRWYRGNACRVFLLLLPVLFCAPKESSAAAVSIDLGAFSFDTLNPGTAQSPGQNQFTIYNFTGTNGLAPDFPVADDLTFLNITISMGGSPVMVSDLAPGSEQPSALTFLDTTEFTSATFSATLSASSFLLADGSTVQLASTTVTGTILPSQGNDLMPDVDLALLSVDGTLVDAPEPSSVAFVVLGLFGVVFSGGLPLAKRPQAAVRPICSQRTV